MEATTKQENIQSKFGAKSTAQQIADNYNLRGKNAIVTGGYSGVGLEITKALAKAGAEVLVPARNLLKAQAALKGISNVKIGVMDLMKPDSIDVFAEQFLSTGKKLHLLINDAGIMTPPLQRDSRGYESQFSTNHLGHFQLTARLWPALVNAEGARVVAVSSRAQRWGGVLFDDPHFSRTAYDPKRAYAQSKSANVLFAVELDRLGRAYGVRAFAAHPGLVPSTNLGSSSMGEDASGLATGMMKIVPRILRLFRVTSVLNLFKQLKSHHVGDEFKTSQQGAATPVWCALSGELSGKGGVYCEDCNIAVAVEDSNSPYGVLPWAIDPVQATRLWSLSEELTGISDALSFPQVESSSAISINLQ